MPFLFIDYDQGAGGEYFCLEVSKSNKCRQLEYLSSESGRIKIQDVFDQEWLKPNPKLTKTVNQDPLLYDVVPTHRKSKMAEKLLGDIKSLRIKFPKSIHLQSFLRENQRKKVLLNPLPNDQYFLGELKILLEQADNGDFVKKVTKDMDYITLLLMSKGIDPTAENKVRFIKKKFDTVVDEPDYHYDLAIELEDLIFDRIAVIQRINDTFDLDLEQDSFGRFQQDYFDYALSK